MWVLFVVLTYYHDGQIRTVNASYEFTTEERCISAREKLYEDIVAATHNGPVMKASCFKRD